MPFGLDPELSSALPGLAATLQKLGSAPAEGDYTAWRNFNDTFIGYLSSLIKPDPDVSIQSFSTTSEDSHDVPLYWYAKAGSSPGSAILYFHGGGMISASAVLYHSIVSDLVSRTGVPAFAVEFRNAPYSAPLRGLHDAYAGLTYLASHAKELGVDPERIIIAGDSGGGGLAASLAHLVVERNGPKIAKQVLIYPMLDDRTGLGPPDVHMAPYANIDASAMNTCWGGVLGERRAKEDVSPIEAAARIKSAVGLPPMYLDVGDCDLFRDEGVEYVRKFWADGVPAELHVFKGCNHGFDRLAPEAKVAQVAWEARVRAIQEV